MATQTTSSNGTAFWSGLGELDIWRSSYNFASGVSDFAKLQSAPVTFVYNLPALIGTTDYPANALPGSPSFSNSTQWPWSVKWPWSMQQRVTPDISANAIGQDVANYLAQTIAGKGLFSPLVPGAQDGFVSMSSFNYQQHAVKRKDVNLGPDFDYVIQTALDGYNKILTKQSFAGRNAIDFGKNDQNNVFVLGPYSNTDIVLGNGNNVIANSPVMFDAVSAILQQPTGATYPQKKWNEVFYPSAQGLKGSNTLKVGDGNNVIYYDSSIAKIMTGNGDNVFLPSFGSFNWAYNNFQQQTGVNGAAPASNGTWLTPVTQEALSNSGAYTLANRYALIANLPSGYGVNDPDYAQMVFVGSVAGAPNNPSDPKTGVIDVNLLPKIGGEFIAGGKGDDVFYGIDPKFFSYQADGQVGFSGEDSRTVFKIADQSTKNERFSYQQYETVTMVGGGGNDLFYLGDPTDIGADGLHYRGSFSYQIATSHSALATEAQKKQLAYGNLDFGANTIVINLSANVNNYTNSAQSFDPKTGKDPSGVDLYKAGMGVSKSLAKTYKVFDKLPGKNIIPWNDMFWSAVQGIETVVKLLAPPDPKPITLDTTTLSQPLGDWRKAVEINDWNPGTIVRINVDPTITTAPKSARWSNIEFTIDAPGLSSDASFGTTVSYKQNGTAKPLLRLDGLGHDIYGYQSYDFETGKYTAVTQKNLAFMGTIAIGVDGINPLKNYTAYNGFVFSSTDPSTPSMAPGGAYQFYWNDQSNSQIDLTPARESARDISIQFDSRSLGWYWQPELVSSLPKGAKDVSEEAFVNSLSVDNKASKLWIESAPGRWTYFTFDQFDTNVEAYRSSLLAKTFYQINGAENLVSDEQEFTNTLVKGLVELKAVVPDLALVKPQGSGAAQLTTLRQITHIEAGQDGAGHKGVAVYFKTLADGDNVYKTFIYKNGQDVVSDAAIMLSANDVLKAETQYKADINLNSIKGPAAFAQAFTPPASASVADIVTGIYSAILERDPDKDGFGAWTAALGKGETTREHVLVQFLTSDEFIAQQGSNEEFITHLYGHLLNRSGEAIAVENWVAAMDRGMTYADIVNLFVGSKEFAALVGVQPA